MPRKQMILLPTPMNEYGSLIRKFRLRQGYTQHELAALAGISRGSLAMFERGQRNLIPDQIEALLKIFGAHSVVEAPASFAFEEKAEPVRN